MERGIGHVQAELLTQPLLQLHIAGKPTCGRQAGLELREHGRRQRLLARWRPGLFVGQQGLQPAGPIAAEPDGHGIPVHGQMGGGVTPGGHLARFEQD